MQHREFRTKANLTFWINEARHLQSAKAEAKGPSLEFTSIGVLNNIDRMHSFEHLPPLLLSIYHLF